MVTETIAQVLAPPRCEHCGMSRPVMVAMKPGKDERPWSLCSRCWLEGVRPMNQFGAATDKKEPKTIVVGPEVGDALKKSGWKVTEAAPGAKPTKTKRRAARG